MAVGCGTKVDPFSVSLPLPLRLGDDSDEQVSVHPEWQACERESVDWIRRFELAEAPAVWAKMACTRPAMLASRCYRSATFEALVLGADLIAWLFLFDDQQGEGPDIVEMAALCDEYEGVLATADLPPHPAPLHVALADLRERMLRLSGPSWCERFCSSMRMYFDGCLLEVPYRRSGRSPSFRNYRLLRSWSIGTFPVLDVIEPALGFTLPDEVVTSPTWRELRELTVQLCAWTNDIYSFNKECDERDPINLVQVIRRENGLPAEDAHREAIRYRQAELARFRVLRARHDGRADTSSIERAYSAALEEWIHGNAAWSGSTHRYRSERALPTAPAWER